MARKQKTKSDVPGRAAVRKPPATKAAKADIQAASDVPTIGHNQRSEEDDRELFNALFREWEPLNGAKNSAVRAMQAFEKKLIQNGFTGKQMKVAIDLKTPEGEERVRARVEGILRAGKYVGVTAFGDLLGNLAKPDMTPSVDRAFDEGKQRSMTGGSYVNPYHQTVPQHKAFSDGYYEHQQKLAGGYKQLDDKDISIANGAPPPDDGRPKGSAPAPNTISDADWQKGRPN